MASPLGSAPSIILGVGLGAAGAAAIEPLIEPARQTAWANNPNKVLDPAMMAALVAQGAVELGAGQEQAKREGYDADRFDRLVYLAQRAPDLAITLELWRRGKFGAPNSAAALALVDHALAKEQIEAQYWPAIKDLFSERLDPPVIALAIVRGIMKDPGFLPVGPPTTEGKVKAFPTSPLDPLLEAQASGYDSERLFVEVANTGRPAPPNEAARATFRGIIEPVDFQRAISEGDIRNEWAATLFEVAREILTAHDYAELELRGFLTRDQRLALTDKHGMSHADSDHLYDVLGRSIPVHQIVTGLARGGKFPGSYDNVPEPFKSSIQRSNIREEYAELAYANRYTYESVFVMRTLVESGDLTEQQGHDDLLAIGWRPDRAASVSAAWAAKAGAVAKMPWLAKAQQQTWTATHKDYTKGAVTRVQAEAALQTFIPDVAERELVFEQWDTEKGLGAAPGPPA